MDASLPLLFDFFSDTEIVIPITQIVLFLSLSTLALLFGSLKAALIMNYLFALYWGYLSNLGVYTELFEQAGYMITIYFGFGVIIALLAIAGFIAKSD